MGVRCGRPFSYKPPEKVRGQTGFLADLQDNSTPLLETCKDEALKNAGDGHGVSHVTVSYHIGKARSMAANPSFRAHFDIGQHSPFWHFVSISSTHHCDEELVLLQPSYICVLGIAAQLLLFTHFNRTF